jgi:hypothetical protein
MAFPNGQLYARDEKDIPFLRIMKEIPIKGRVMMIGDGEYLEPLMGSSGDEFFGRIFYAVQWIVSRMKMEVRLKGSYDFDFLVRFFSQFSSTFLQWTQTGFILQIMNESARTHFSLR